MIDRISPTLVDSLGATGQYRATLNGEVVDGGLRLWSTGMRFGVIPLPARVEVAERWVDGLQHVAVTITAPVVGRVYEYSGYFRYEIMEQHVFTP